MEGTCVWFSLPAQTSQLEHVIRTMSSHDCTVSLGISLLCLVTLFIQIYYIPFSNLFFVNFLLFNDWGASISGIGDFSKAAIYLLDFICSIAFTKIS